LTGFFVILPGGRNAVALARDAHLRRKMRAEDGAPGWFSATGSQWCFGQYTGFKQF